MSPRPVIEVSGLTKRYGENEVLSGIGFTVEAGEVFALLGANGAGKTTTISILSTLVRPDSGTARVCGFDVVAEASSVRRSISLTGQFASVDGFQTGRENLTMMARLAHLGSRAASARSTELLEQFDLTDAANKRVGAYSGGMRRRLDLAISLIARPPVVFLDEPTTGLDPRSRSQLWSVVRDLVADGTTIVLTTQYLDEADHLADRVAVLGAGEVIAEGAPAQLKSRVEGQHVEFSFEDARSFDLALSLCDRSTVADDDRRAGSQVSLTPERTTPELFAFTVPSTAPVLTIQTMLGLAERYELAIADVSIVKPTLDDVFLALTATDAAGSADAASATADAQTEGVAA